MKPPSELHNMGSLITYADEGKERCLGYLMHFSGHGVFEPKFGLMDITPEDAKAHNECLSKAELEGLDQNCQVGQGGTFYYIKGQGVHTFTGTEVAPMSAVQIKGQWIKFTRSGKTYRGKLSLEYDMFNFRRIS